MPNCGSRQAALWIGLMWFPLLASCPSESPEAPATQPSEPAATAKPVEILLSGGELPVHIDTPTLANGDHYGTVTITSPTDPPTSVEIPLLAHVSGNKPAPQEGQTPDDPLQVFRAIEHADALLQATTEPQWIKPPPEIAESGVEYEVEHTRVRREGSSDVWVSINFAEDAGLTHSSKGSTRYGSPSVGTTKQFLRFETCSDAPVYVYLATWEEGVYKNFAPVRVQVTHPTQAVPLFAYFGATSRSTTEGTGAEKIGNAKITSLCGQRLTWKLTTDAAWLKISPETGTIDTGEATPELTVVKDGLRAGNKQAQLTVSAEGSERTSSTSVYLTVSALRLRWSVEPPSDLQSGEAFLAQFEPVPDLVPDATVVLADLIEGDHTGYSQAVFPALPTPDGVYVTPVRLITCTGATFKVRAVARESKPSYLQSEALRARVQISPARNTVLEVTPLTLEFTTDDTRKTITKFLSLNQKCGKESLKISASANRPWIVLEDSGVKPDPVAPQDRIYWTSPPH